MKPFPRPLCPRGERGGAAGWSPTPSPGPQPSSADVRGPPRAALLRSSGLWHRAGSRGLARPLGPARWLGARRAGRQVPPRRFAESVRRPRPSPRPVLPRAASGAHVALLPPRATMAASSARPAVLAMTALALLLTLCLGPGGVSGNKLKLMLQKWEAPAPAETSVAAEESKAKEFLSGLRRQKRQLWDRSRPEVQQCLTSKNVRNSKVNARPMRTMDRDEH
ncbi:augurin isoform X2 [Manis javanica]|uniref:augurin isoform X2 n=1 Tax=Manis javanica TaxID=9974 RepID=UPI003C6DA465